MIWNEEAECMAAEEKEELQLKRLQEVVKRAYENVNYYKKAFDQKQVFLRRISKP